MMNAYEIVFSSTVHHIFPKCYILLIFTTFLYSFSIRLLYLKYVRTKTIKIHGGGGRLKDCLVKGAVCTSYIPGLDTTTKCWRLFLPIEAKKGYEFALVLPPFRAETLQRKLLKASKRCNALISTTYVIFL